MHVTPYLFFNGECEAAFKFYEQCLGGTIAAMIPFTASPEADQVPPGCDNRIMHARLVAGDAVLMGSDCPAEYYERPAGHSVSLHVQDPAEAERLFHALAENGTVQMPIQETFWATRFGMLTDRFGSPWMINCEKAG